MAPIASCKHCDQGIYCLRLCFDHYMKRQQDKFWQHVRDTSDPEGCWIWEGKKRGGDYGSFSIGGPAPSRSAHRAAYRFLVGEIEPASLHLDHLCRNPACVNPRHLEPVSGFENLRRGWASQPIPEEPRQIRAAPRPRRQYGSGSMIEVAPGVFKLRVSAGRDVMTGKPRIITERFRGTKRQADDRLAHIRAHYGGGQVTATKATLGSLIERWMTTARLEPGTVRNYRNALRHLPDRVLSMPLNQVGAHELDSVYSALSRSGLGAPTIRILHAVLSAALQQAVKWRWIPANPARSASPPPARRGQSSAPESATLASLMVVAQDRDPQLHLWLRLAIVTGARRGEVLALRWGDLTGDRLTISGSIDYDRSRKTTKTGDVRAITVDPSTVAVLTAWQRLARERALAVGHRLGRSDYILSDEADFSQPWRPDVASKRFRRLCVATGVNGVRLHDLRHAHASQLLAAGVDLATVSRRLGHSRTSTTADVYAHVMPGTDERAAEIASRNLDSM